MLLLLLLRMRLLILGLMLLLLLLLQCLLLMMAMIVTMVVTLSRPQHLVSLLIKIAFLLKPRQFDLYTLKLVLQIPISCLEILALLQPFAPAVLSITAILQRPPLLLQSHDLFSRRTMEAFVELAHGE